MEIIIYPNDCILVAIMNNKKDWYRVQNEGWYRVPSKHAPSPVPNIDYIAFYFTKNFGSDKWAVHYYAAVKGHELLTRRDIIPSEPEHKRAGKWYYKMELGPIQHKLPPILSNVWKRITFIITTGDRFEVATEISQLFDNQSAYGRQSITLKEGNY